MYVFIRISTGSYGLPTYIFLTLISIYIGMCRVADCFARIAPAEGDYTPDPSASTPGTDIGLPDLARHVGRINSASLSA